MATMVSSDEDVAPPGVRAAAIARWALVALMAMGAGAAWIHYLRSTPALVQGAAQYQCPMHPDLVQAQPGHCSICGMDLVPVGQRKPAGESADRAPVQALPGQPGGPVPGLVPLTIPAERTQLVGMRTARATRERLSAQLRTIGFVTAEDSSVTVVTARFSGWIDDVSVAQAGERIEKGRVIATVSGPELLSAQQVYLAATEWASKQRQSVGGVKVAGVDEDNALKRLGFAERDVAAVRKRGRPFESLPIRSPVTGYVAKRNVLPGLHVEPGSELLRIVDLSKVWVVAEVPQKDAGRLQAGESARFSIAAASGRVFTGKIDLVYPAMDPDTRTLRARLELTNAGLELRPGMYGEVLIDVPASESITVPSEAVVDTGELQYVCVDRANGHFEPRTVRVGASSGGRVQVLEGLAEGDRVVTTANFLVDSESRLRAAVEAFGAPPRRDQGTDAAKGRHVQTARSP